MGMSKDAILNIIMKELNPKSFVDKNLRGLVEKPINKEYKLELGRDGRVVGNPIVNKRSHQIVDKRSHQEKLIQAAYESSKNPTEFKANLEDICKVRKGLRGQFSGTKTAITRGLKIVEKQELASQRKMGPQPLK